MLFFDAIIDLWRAALRRFRALLRHLRCIFSTTRPEWLTDFDDATALARSTDRIVLANFSGSDWCRHCITLKREVFDTVRFKCWAASKVVLLEVDFPIETTLPPEQAAHNERLRSRYNVTGYPTIIGIDPDGTALGRLSGYGAGTGPNAWIRDFEAATGLDRSTP